MKILITGPESTGKSTLGMALSQQYQIPYIDEIARRYLEENGPEYALSDIEEIAKLNIQEYKSRQDTAFIMDTYLLNLMIWIQIKYGVCPKWIEEAWEIAEFDLILLCYPDIPWVMDPFRESPQDRMTLFNMFMESIEKLNVPFGIVKGLGKERTNNASEIINNTLLS